MLKLAEGRPNSFLLELVEGGAQRGRYSVLGMRPDLIWRCRGNKAELNRQARFDPNAFAACPVGESQGALASLRAVVAESEIDIPSILPPMAAGLVGYMGYDMVRLVERLPDDNPDPIGIPDGMFLRPTVMAIFDNVDDGVTVVTPIRPQSGVNARAAYGQACERLADVVADFERSLPFGRDAGADGESPPTPVPEMSAGQFKRNGRQRQGIHPRRRYLPGGAVPALAVPFRLPPFALYRACAAPIRSPVPVLSRFRRIRPGRLEPGDPGPPARRQGHHPAAGRHPAARRRRRRGQGARRRNCWPIPRSWPST